MGKPALNFLIISIIIYCILVIAVLPSYLRQKREGRNFINLLILIIWPLIIIGGAMGSILLTVFINLGEFFLVIVITVITFPFFFVKERMEYPSPLNKLWAKWLELSNRVFSLLSEYLNRLFT
jgi:hypothetical protein